MILRSIINNTTLLVLIAALFSCSKEPTPINYGKDFCDHCRMKIVDERFGAEMVTKQGKVFKFDALECMVNYHQELDQEKQQNVLHLLVANAAAKGSLLEVTKAVYLRSENFPSPMGSNISAYGDATQREPFIKEYDGALLTWEEAQVFIIAKKHKHH